MQIPEISPLFLISVCGFSLVCVGVIAVVAFIAIRFVGGEVFDGIGGIFARDPDVGGDPDIPEAAVRRRDLRAKAQSSRFDDALIRKTDEMPIPKASDYGDSFERQSGTAPRTPASRRSSLTEKASNWDPTQYSGEQTDSSSSSSFEPTERNLRGSRSLREQNLRSSRRAADDDEMFGGMFDFDGDGDPDT